MNLNRALMNILVAVIFIHVASHLVMWTIFPDHDQGEHSLLTIGRRIQKEGSTSVANSSNKAKKQENNVKSKPVEANQDSHSSSNQHNRRQMKRHKLFTNERKRQLPTAQTISPYLEHPLFAGKEKLLTMLHEAHYFNDSASAFFQDDAKVEALASKLPLWKTITDRLGGDKPVIVGLDTCEKFQELIPAPERFLGVAGSFGTGTNLLASLLVANCVNKARMDKYKGGSGVRWQVNWGKHSPARYRLENLLDPELINENYLPVVTTRHPYSWMHSLCRSRYSTHWFHHAQQHCPNLIPNDIDRKWYNFTIKYGKRGVHALFKDPWLRDNLLDLANYTLESEVVPVRVRYKSGTLFHDSLVHFWSDWYNEYVKADFPRLIVRLEDLVFHAKEVTTKVCSCIGGSMSKDFQYITETARVGDDKIHGKDRTNLIKWFTKWHLEDRTQNMTTDDIAYAQEMLDPELMNIFNYQHPEPFSAQG